MSRYGINYYGISNYGTSSTVIFDASPFTALSYGYGQIKLDWVDPIGRWSDLRVVRNPYGHPVNAYDGLLITQVRNGYDPVTIIDNNGLTEGAFYYYSIFVYDVVNQAWSRAADATGLSVKRWGNQTKLWEYLPEVYKTSTLYNLDTTEENSDLISFLNVFGFELDTMQTLTNLLLNRYDIQKVGGMLLPTMMKQFGLDYEPTIGYQQGRILVRDAIQFYKEKGSDQGLKEFIKAYCGWGVPAVSATAPLPTIDGVVMGHNLMLDYNDSSFEEGIGHWKAVEATTLALSLRALNVTQISLTSNTVRMVIGAHSYKVGAQVTVSGMKDPLFNTATPVTVTAINSDWIEYALTSSNVSLKSGYNTDTLSYGKVFPSPAAWVEPSAPYLYPNKTNGILSLYNNNGSATTVSAFCGDTSPIVYGVPVEAGTTYTFSVFVARGNHTAKDVTAKIKWYDRFGVLISTSSGTPVTATSAVFDAAYRPHVSAAAPSGSYYAVPGIEVASLASQARHYFDCAQFEASASATDFDEARQLHITLRANRINELVNPVFDTTITPWSVTGATMYTDYDDLKPDTDEYTVLSVSVSANVATLTLLDVHPFAVGESIAVKISDTSFNGAKTVTATTERTISYALTHADLVDTTVTGTMFDAGEALDMTAVASSVELSSITTDADMMPVYYPETVYTFSIYAKDYTNSEHVTVSIVWCDSSKNVISTTTSELWSLNRSWSHIYVHSTAPSNAAYSYVKLNWEVGSGNVICVDDAIFENSPFVLEYFDGSHGPSDKTDLFWEGGVPNAGRSHFYKNRVARQGRLVEAIRDFVPLGCTYAVYLAQPQT